VGVQYRWGGESPRTGFDCSGLVRFVYRHFGVNLPHYSYAQWRYGRYVPRTGLKPGDVVFFGGLGHVGVYVGGGRFVHAPHAGAQVSVSPLWAHGGYYGARRLV
jgi:cell wall-associated NlpC family hydrolase